MSEKPIYDDLDEMYLPDSAKPQVEDDIKQPPVKKVATKPSTVVRVRAPKKGQKGVDAETQKRELTITLVVVGIVFVLLAVAILWVSGVLAPPEQSFQMAQNDPDKSSFYNEGNIPELSSKGVMGKLKQAYYTVDGDLAVVLNLSNGTASEQQVVRINAQVFNDKQETVAQQTIDHFEKTCVVPALGFGEVYFVIDRANVVLRNDPLSALGVTLEIASTPTDGSSVDNGDSKEPVVGTGDKDIAPNRSYYENLGNLPELSAEGVKSTILRARYTNDGSLAVTLAFSNGTDAEQTVSRVELHIMNGVSGAAIADYTFDRFDTPTKVPSKGYAEAELMIDASYVSIKDDALSSLSTTISVSAAS